jgi:DNA-3-methyladenine glycosylase
MSASSSALDRDLLERPVLEIAPELLGCVLTHASAEGTVAVRLTEVEAYDGGNDPGSHAFRGRTPRNDVMFGPPGHLYVYFTYGMHWCANIVCGPAGTPSAVLLRAGEVVDGVDLARSRRPTARSDRELARGPARLAGALGLAGAHNGLDVISPGGRVRVRGVGEPPVATVQRGPRVGIGGDAAAWPWRFWLDGEPTVSSYRPHSPRRRTGKAPAPTADDALAAALDRSAGGRE